MDLEAETIFLSPSRPPESSVLAHFGEYKTSSTWHSANKLYCVSERPSEPI